MSNEFEVENEVDFFDSDDSVIDDNLLSGFGEIDVSVDSPHVRIEAKKFLDFLSVARNVVSLAGGAISRIVLFELEGDNLFCYLTDLDVYLSYKIPLINKENILFESFAIPVETLQRVLSGVPSHIIIYKKEDSFYVKLAFGDLVLETVNCDYSNFKLEHQFREVGTYSFSDFGVVSNAISQVVSSSSVSLDRRIIFEESGAYASYFWSLIKCSGNFPPIELGMRDAKVIRSLSTVYSGDMVYSTSEEGNKVLRDKFSTEIFSYSFLRGLGEVPSVFKSVREEIFKGDRAFIDRDQLSRMLGISANLPYSFGTVDFNYDSKGIQVILNTSKGENTFNFISSEKGDPLESSISVLAKMLYNTIKVFHQSTLEFYLSDKGIGLKADNITAVIYKGD